ncbi:MAG: ATP-binding protein [Gammaproteobacteria bacterium]
MTNNALKYTEKGGVLLTCRKQKESLEIYVIDTGSGLNNDEKELIFKDFYRLDKHVSNKQEQGLGLGLSIVDRIIKQLGHNLTIRSIPGKGSSFRLTVPMVTPEIIQLENTTVTTEKQTQQVSKAKILCIDNDGRILEGMNLLVSNWGYPIRCALGRTQAYQILDDGFAPEILLVDYHLDNETGLQLIEDVFKKYQFQCPVIVITANRTEELKAEIEQGNFYLLNKPIRPAVLRSIINKLQI